MEQVVLVHLSDIHFRDTANGVARRHESVRTDLVNDLREMRSRIGDATTIVVTGDIAFSGAMTEYNEAGRWLDEVAGVVGTDRAKVLTVPGNHDVDLSKVGKSAELAHKQLRDCSSNLVDRELEDMLLDPGRPLLGKLDNYNLFASRYDCQVPADGRPWETLIPLDDGYTLSIRGLCSVFNSDKQDRQQLLIGKAQATLRAEAGKIYLLLAHHGPGDCRDGEMVRDKTGKRAAALLTGHRHDQRIRKFDQCVEVSAGAVNPEDEHGWYPAYNWIRIGLTPEADPPSVTIEIWPRQWKPEWDDFGSAAQEGDSDSYTVLISKHAVQQLVPVAPATASALPIPSSGSLSPSTAFSATAGPRSGGSDDPGAASGAGGNVADTSEGSAEPRPALEDEHGEVALERRVRRDLFDLPVPAQYRALSDCGLLADEDWMKGYLMMIGDAITAARERGSLNRLHEAIRDAPEGAAR